MGEAEYSPQATKSRRDQVLAMTIVVLGLAMVIFQLMNTFTILQCSNRQLNMHLAFALLLVFLTALQKQGKYRPLAMLFLLASLFGVVYMHILEPDLIMRIGLPTSVDIIVGVILILVCYEASRLAFGLVLPIVGLVFLAYTFLGHYVPGLLHHPPVALDRGLTFLVLGFDGLYGVGLFTSLVIIFYFILFGALLQAAGAGEFFIEVGRIAGRKVRSGPALTSVLSSSMVATVTGTPAPNIILTGSITIPLMKRAGFKSEVAGAVEACASTGGQIMPPVMGAAAFLMASITGIAYVSIMLAAIIPALLYYLPLGLGVQLHALRHDIRGFMGGEVDYRLMWRRALLFVIPLAIIVYLLIDGFSPMYAASWAILGCFSLSLIGLLSRLLSKKSPLTLAQFWDWCKRIGRGLVQGAILGSQIAVIVALLGTVINAIALTGMDIKLCSAVEAWSGGILLLALVITGLISMLLGCGLPAIAAYLIVAIAVAPVLTRMGVGLLEAHFFVFWCSIMGWMTPPVATSPLIASKLAGAGFLRTCWQAIRLAAPGWLIPFILVLTPSLLGQFTAGPLEAFTSVLFAILGLCSLTIMVHGQLFTKLNIKERALAALATMGLIGYFFTSHFWLMAAGGLGCLALVILWQSAERRHLKPEAG